MQSSIIKPLSKALIAVSWTIFPQHFFHISSQQLCFIGESLNIHCNNNYNTGEKAFDSVTFFEETVSSITELRVKAFSNMAVV